MELDCPLCHAPLDVKGSSAHCAQCERVFTLEARCPECHQPLEVLKACGAVDYFCQHGHGLISKKKGGIYSAGLVGEGFLARVFFTGAICFTSLSTQPSFRRVVSRSPVLTCFVCFSTVPSLTEVTL